MLVLFCFHVWTDFEITSNTNMENGNILYKFVFKHFKAKVKVTVAVITFSLFWSSHLQTDLNVTLHRCLV